MTDYVTNTTINTTLMGNPRSGKTTMMWNRIKFLIDNKIFAKDDIFIICHSNTTMQHFVRKINNYMNVYTWDTFAQRCLNIESKMANLAQLRLRDVLKNNEIKQIKIIFVDDAQDLNQIQNDIIHLLYMNNKTYINLIGNPNESVCSFKGCNSELLQNSEHLLKSKIYKSSDLKTNHVLCEFSKNILLNKPQNIDQKHIRVIQYESYTDIIKLIQIMNNQNKLHGTVLTSPRKIVLETIMKLLSDANIKFNYKIDHNAQLYDNKCLIISTCTQMKGLEYNDILLVDCHYKLFGVDPRDLDEYNEHKRILHMVTSRAHNTIIILYNKQYDIHPSITGKMIEFIPKIQKINDIVHILKNRDVLFNKMHIDVKKEIMFDPITETGDDLKMMMDIIRKIFEMYVTNSDIKQLFVDKLWLFDKYKTVYDNIHKFIKSLKNIRTNVYVSYKNLNIHNTIDFLIDDKIILNICESDINTYIVILMLDNFCYNKTLNTTGMIFDIKTGILHNVKIKVDDHDVFHVLNQICDLTSWKFNDMYFVYDTETTGLIVKNKYPKIIELSIKDYNTNMIIFDALINPGEKLSDFIVELTKITDNMLNGGLPHNKLHSQLNHVFRNIKHFTMMAYNGFFFDDKIMRYYSLSPYCSWIDIMMLIKLYIDKKPINYKLVTIHKHILECEFEAHRAMSDVNACINIMKKLNISL
jgi:hypothetical protein